MRKNVISTIIAILALCTVGITACGIDTSTPEGTVRAFHQAEESQNATAMANYIDPSLSRLTREEWIAAYEEEYNRIESISITDQEISVESQDDTSATVVMTCHYKVVMNDGGVRESDPHYYYELEKTDGKWLITSWQ